MARKLGALIRALRETVSAAGGGARAMLGKPGTGHLAAVCDCKFVPSRHSMRPVAPLITCDGIGQVRLWDVTAPASRPLSVVASAHVGSVNGIATSDTTSLFVTAGDDGLVRVWDPEVAGSADALQTFRGHLSFASGCAFSSSAFPLVASVSLDATARLWDTRSPDAVFVFNLRTAARSVEFVPASSSLLLTAGNDGVFLWDVRKHSSFLEAVDAFGPSSSSSQVPSTPASHQLHRNVLETPVARTRSAPLSAAATTAAAAHQQKAPARSPAVFSAKFLFFNSPHPLAARSTNSSNSAGTSLPEPATSTAVAAADRPLAVFHDANTSLELRFNKFARDYRQQFTGHTGAPYSVVALENGCHILTSACDNAHKLWDLHLRRGVCTYDGADLSHSTVPAVSSPGDELVLCGSSDGSVLLWDTHASADASAPAKAKQQGGNSVLRIPSVHRFPVTANCWLPGNVGIVTADTSGAVLCVQP